MDPGSALQQFLQSLQVDNHKIHTLSSLFYSNFRHLAIHASDQFLPTPISESILRPVSQAGHGSGGTNLRVGFVELSLRNPQDDDAPNGRRQTNGDSPSLHIHERSWPIDDRLKANGGSDSDPQALFDWIGARIAEVVRSASPAPSSSEPLPLGITFSFPMVQHSISDATVMTMGKGFSMSSTMSLGDLLLRGYEKSRSEDLPPLTIAAISNDSVSTLISFIYLFPESASRKASMGLILGTGCNATVPLKLSLLGSEKRPGSVSTLVGESAAASSLDDVRIAVNTEWSIRGTAPPLRELGLITKWDAALDAALVGPSEIAGFQPLEYMTAGRYLGELGRLMLLDYLGSVLRVDPSLLPPGLLARYALSTTFLSHFRPLDPPALLRTLEAEFPTGETDFAWTEEVAAALYHIAKAIELRAAGIIAAGIVALLKLAGDVPPPSSVDNDSATTVRELGVGYTGGCISHFQDYLADTQAFLHDIVKLEYDGRPPPVRVVLSPCHDGGIKGAGILAAATGASEKRET
ncbi:hexokinase-1 [Colletotrichum sojae]|uniref:Phosphotransferase n=1 Tax=Colletotrichum sojae TaxID=2175907 RepID=A0A8H6JFK9_9PEZI|nr:hexokinase-1 [Colletotrichum sojae]